MRLATVAAGGLAAIAIALPGCGDEGATGDAGGDRAARADAAQRFAQCMRRNGVEGFPDPDERGMFRITPGSERVPAATHERARRACERHLRAAGPPEPLSEEEQAEALDRLARFNRCMREHGVDLPPPTVDDGRAAQALGDNAIDSPRFERAQRACESIMRRPEDGR